MRTSIIAFLILAVATLGCKKQNENGGSPQSPISKRDTVLGILLSTREVVAGQLTTYLTFYDTTGAVKWKRTGNDNGGTPYPAYHNGKVYFPVSTYFPATQSGYFTLYNLGINNGAEQWKYRDANASFATPVVVNDTLYVANYQSLYAFGPGGNVIYNRPISNLQPLTPATDGKYLFLVSAPIMTAFYSMHAFDIKTRSIVWTVQLGYNPPQSLFVWNDVVCFVDGSLRLQALNKNTGAVKWSKTNQQYGTNVFDDKNVYTFNHQSPDGVYAFDMNSGTQVWKYPYPIQKDHLYLFNKKLYVMGWSGNKRYMNCVNTTTGDTLWRKPVDINASFSAPVVTDRDVIYLKSGMNDNIARILRFDAETFAAKDSFVVQAAEAGHPKVIMRSGAAY